MKGITMPHPLEGVPDPFAVIEPPRFRRCECGEITQNCDGRCDTCDRLDSDEFGRAAIEYSRCSDPQCGLCNFIEWSE